MLENLWEMLEVPPDDLARQVAWQAMQSPARLQPAQLDQVCFSISACGVPGNIDKASSAAAASAALYRCRQTTWLAEWPGRPCRALLACCQPSWTRYAKHDWDGLLHRPPVICHIREMQLQLRLSEGAAKRPRPSGGLAGHAEPRSPAGSPAGPGRLISAACVEHAALRCGCAEADTCVLLLSTAQLDQTAQCDHCSLPSKPHAPVGEGSHRRSGGTQGGADAHSGACQPSRAGAGLCGYAHARPCGTGWPCGGCPPGVGPGELAAVACA